MSLGFVVKSFDVAILLSRISIFLRWLTVVEDGKKMEAATVCRKGGSLDGSHPESSV
jgi:hypothetical protein